MQHSQTAAAVCRRGGNRNNFETRGQCEAACGGGGSNTGSSNKPADKVTMFPKCRGGAFPVSAQRVNFSPPGSCSQPPLGFGSCSANLRRWNYRVAGL